MLPFDAYPDGGQKLLGYVTSGKCRHGYGLKFMQKTGQTCCAYCGLDFSVSYENWLSMELDHVVPLKVCNSLVIPRDWFEDFANKVLACRACNGFNNHYMPPVGTVCPTTVEAFFSLRDIIFLDRKAEIEQAHEQERACYDKRLWEQRKG